MGVVVAKKRREFMMSDGDKIYFTVSCSHSVPCFLIFLQLFVVPKTDVPSSPFSTFVFLALGQFGDHWILNSLAGVASTSMFPLTLVYN